MTRLPIAMSLALIVGLSACSEFPELDETVDSDAAYPELVPVESLTARAPDPRLKPETSPELSSRMDRLRARAAGLKRDVIDEETQARMDAGIE